MASQSTMLALRIPWTEEPGGLQSMGSQKVRHALVTKQQKQHMLVFVFWTSLTLCLSTLFPVLQGLKICNLYFTGSFVGGFW